MTTNMIGTVIIQIVIGILLIVECYLYFGKKGEAGEVVKSIPVPLKYNVIKVVVYAAIFLIWFYARVLLIQGDYTKMDLIYAAVLLVELIIAIILDNLPQQICENGVVTQRGYMAWSQIQNVEISEKPEIVQLKVNEKVGFMQQIFCLEADKKAIEEYVAEHMNYIPDVNDQTEIEVAKEAMIEVEAETEIVEEVSVEAETETEIVEEVSVEAETETEIVEEASVEAETETEVAEESPEEISSETEAETAEEAGEDSTEEEMEYDQISEWHEESEIEESTDEKEE